MNDFLRPLFGLDAPTDWQMAFDGERVCVAEAFDRKLELPVPVTRNIPLVEREQSISSTKRRGLMSRLLRR
jgi:hypothetical protein